MYKLVPEHINEVYNFERRQDKMSSLGVGKKQLIISWLDEMRIKDYFINDDLTIDVNNYVYLYNKNLVEFPNYIQFNEVVGDFYCDNNQLISLKGCPKIVVGDFFCQCNNLTSLQGCPTSVGGNFYCYNNKIQFIPSEVRKHCKVQSSIIYKNITK